MHFLKIKVIRLVCISSDSNWMYFDFVKHTK